MEQEELNLMIVEVIQLMGQVKQEQVVTIRKMYSSCSDPVQDHESNSLYLVSAWTLNEP